MKQTIEKCDFCLAFGDDSWGGGGGGGGGRANSSIYCRTWAERSSHSLHTITVINNCQIPTGSISKTFIHQLKEKQKPKSKKTKKTRTKRMAMTIETRNYLVIQSQQMKTNDK